MLDLGDEDGKPSNSLKKEEVISVVSVLRSIRRSEDAVDAHMSKNSYAICDLCFSITKRLAQKQEDLKEPVVHVPVPEVLYKPHKKKDEKTEEEKEEKTKEKKEQEKDEKTEEEKEEEKVEEKEEGSKEDGDTDVTEGQTWLADASALAHFESLNLEDNESIPSKIPEDDMLKDSVTDGNEVPLGKMLKRLKAQGAKERKAVKNGSTPAAAAAENDGNVDILGMVREINLDNSGVSTRFDSINGHEKPKADEKRKRKRIANESINVSVPKCQRSSSAKGHKRSSIPKGLSAFDNIKMNDEPHSVSENEVSLREHNEPANLEGESADRGHIQAEEHGNTDDSDLEKPKKYINTGGNQKSGSVKKRKRRSIAGLAKCTSKEGESHTADLIGRRIKVWWPMDKEFYEGLVKSYDHQMKKHVVLYNDGDVEVLRLDEERWELIDKTSKPTKRNKLAKSPRPKGEE